MLKLPSVKSLLENAQKTFYRFPFVLLTAFLGTVLALHSIDHMEGGAQSESLIRMVMTCILGLSVFINLTLIGERYKWKPLFHYGSQVVGVILLLGYYLFVHRTTSIVVETRFFLIFIALHLLASFSVYIRKGSVIAFWQFNKLLFFRVLNSGLYTVTLYLGLLLAVIAVDKLFELNFQSNIYAKLWFTLIGIFNTWFFLAGVPEEYDELEQETAFPKGLKVFAQYVLIPLVTVYLVILYFYMGKILLQWKLPVGWVSYLVIGFSTAGIFSLLLMYPIRNSEGNSWIRTYSKWYYVALYPLIVLLFIAIGKRISDYGITENRYFILVIAVWLLGIALYFSISAKKNIKVIPVSLCILAFLTSFGPWGAFSVAERNQLRRLETLLQSSGNLVNGKLQKSAKVVDDYTQKKISSVIEYFKERKNLEVLKPWLTPEEYSFLSPESANEKELMQHIGLQFAGRWENEFNNLKYFNFMAERPGSQSVNISGYEECILINIRDQENLRSFRNVNTDTIQAKYFEKSRSLAVLCFSDTLLTFNMDSILAKLQKENKNESIPSEMMKFVDTTRTTKGELRLTHIIGVKSDTSLVLSNIQGCIFLKK